MWTDVWLHRLLKNMRRLMYILLFKHVLPARQQLHNLLAPGTSWLHHMFYKANGWYCTFVSINMWREDLTTSDMLVQLKHWTAVWEQLTSMSRRRPIQINTFVHIKQIQFEIIAGKLLSWYSVLRPNQSLITDDSYWYWPFERPQELM